MFGEALSACIERFGAAPREISLWDRLTYWRIVRPEWIYQYPDDPLETLFLGLRKLRREGRVVWGHFIQANSHLYAPGQDDQGAEIVYSLDPSNSISPSELERVAQALGSLKHTKPDDPELASIADYLTDEYTRVFGKPVPASISPSRPCLISSIYVVRKHLPGPGHFLSQAWLPIVVSPNPPHHAILLPSRYWPEELVRWWNHG